MTSQPGWTPERFLNRLQPSEVPAGAAEAWVHERMLGIVSYGLRIKKTLVSERSQYQQIDLLESQHHGKVLLLDGCVMLTELDEFIYHEMLAHTGAVTLDAPERALVIGGGDGGIVRELLKTESFSEVTLAELDERVVRLCQEHLPSVSSALESPRVKLMFGDGAAHIAALPQRSLDLVVVDSTDPVGAANALITEGFYRQVQSALKPGGVLVAQTQSPFYHPQDMVEIYQALGRVFKRVWMYWAVCPAYLGNLWTFCFASDERHPLEHLPAEEDLHLRLGTRYYSRGVHQGAFALPPFLQACLPAGHPQRRLP